MKNFRVCLTIFVTFLLVSLFSNIPTAYANDTHSEANISEASSSDIFPGFENDLGRQGLIGGIVTPIKKPIVLPPKTQKTKKKKTAKPVKKDLPTDEEQQIINKKDNQDLLTRVVDYAIINQLVNAIASEYNDTLKDNPGLSGGPISATKRRLHIHRFKEKLHTLIKSHILEIADGPRFTPGTHYTYATGINLLEAKLEVVASELGSILLKSESQTLSNNEAKQALIKMTEAYIIAGLLYTEEHTGIAKLQKGTKYLSLALAAAVVVLNTNTGFENLDLADMISYFGVAPSFVLYLNFKSVNKPYVAQNAIYSPARYTSKQQSKIDSYLQNNFWPVLSETIKSSESNDGIASNLESFFNSNESKFNSMSAFKYLINRISKVTNKNCLEVLTK